MPIKMTKKKIAPVRRFETAKFKVEETWLKCQPKSMPVNLTEEKEKFLKSGKAPQFEVKDRAKLDELASKTKNKIRFELLGEAQYILEKVYDTYGNGEFFLEHAFGIRITKEEATPMLLEYIEDNSLTESLKIHWCDNMACSAKLVWTGPVVHANRPELRRYSLWINGSEENNYMRESGIRCLLDHEIGTHFFRSFNDGFQPWFSDRERFGLRKLGAFEGHCTEEGLAAVNTVLRGRVKLLWGAALAYYTACKAAEMTFKQLFDHLGHYISNREYRWKQAMRVKRGLSDPNDFGGFGNDQCYFEGAVTILRNMDKIDFYLLMTGKVCHDELDRIKRVVRKDVMHYPSFMKNMTAYRKTLRKIVTLNCLNGFHPQRGPSDSHVKRLEDGTHGKKSKKTKKVRSSNKLNLFAKNISDNKKRLKEHGSAESEEIATFKCSHPFINLHQQKKNNLSDNIFENSEASMRSVAKLSEDIVAKDSSLNKQINKLQEIVKRHPWACKDEKYRDGLLEKAEEKMNSTIVFENSECSSPLSITEENIDCTLRNCAMECDTVAVSKETNVCDALVSQNDPKGPKLDFQISPSNSVLSFAENNNCCYRGLESSSSDVPQPSLNPSPLAKATPGNVMKNSYGLLQKRRLPHRQTTKQLFHPPVADFTIQDNVSTELQVCQPLDSTAIKKRISLNCSTKNEGSFDHLETETLKRSSPWSARVKPDNYSFEMDKASKRRDLYRKNELFTKKIQIDFLDLTDEQGPPPRVPDFKFKRQASSSSLSLSSFPSDTDFESFLQFKHHVFQPGANNRRPSVSQPPPPTGEEFLQERSHTTLVSDCRSQSMGSHRVGPSLTMVSQKNLVLGDYYQPLIISSAKSLAHRAFDSP